VVQPRKGERRDVTLTVAPVVGEDGCPTGLRWLLRDTSETRKAEQALRAERDLADSLVDTVEAVGLGTDGPGRLTPSNPVFRTVSGYTREELIGRDWCTLLLPEAEQAQGREMVRRALESGTATAGILTLATKTGQRRSLAWSARSLLAERGTSHL